MSDFISLTRRAVRQAMRECDDLTPEVFLRTYGFRPATDYLLVDGDRTYDSKAVVAVAHKYVPEVGEALTYKQLNGGLEGAVAVLLGLGFEVRPKRDPDWTWDEHVLALELYRAVPDGPPGKQSPQVVGLSALLEAFAARRGVLKTEKFRNPNGVYMKLMNFRRLDPAFKAAGKVGLSRGASGEKAVWDRYADDLDGLRSAAQAIRDAIEDTRVDLTELNDAESAEVIEGALRLRVHLARERSPALARDKKATVLKAQGRLACEACGFDFGERYGVLGVGYIEAHHREPLGVRGGPAPTGLRDLALVCANCHRMLHAGASPPTVEELAAQLAAAALV